MKSKATIQGIYGHVGSGKTGTIAHKLVQCMLDQAPGLDGIKRTKFGLIRKDKDDTKDMLDAVEKWLPDGWWERNNADHTITVDISYADKHGDEVKIQSKFIGVGAKDDKQLVKQKSKNYTIIWMEEADQFPEYAFTLFFKRRDRYPDVSGNPNSMKGFIIISFNPPTKEHWIYKRLILNNNSMLRGKPFIEIIKTVPPLFRRKGGVDENALCHKDGYNYYKRPGGEGAKLHKDGLMYWVETVMASKADSEIRADIFGEFSPSAYGEPVYPDFDATKHVNGQFKNVGELEGEIEDIASVAEEYIIPPMTDRKLNLVFDWEGYPACLLYQIDSIGRMVVLDEVFRGKYVLTELLDVHLRGLLLSKYEGIQKFRIIGDPSGRADHSGKTPNMYIQDFLKNMNIKSYDFDTEVTNSIPLRVDAATQLLKRKDSVIISPVCKFLIQGLDGEYKWEYKRGGNMELKKTPDKGIYSHICNCFEYGCYNILHQFQPSGRTNYRAQRQRQLRRYF